MVLFHGWLIYSCLQVFKLIKSKWLPEECADWFCDNIMTWSCCRHRRYSVSRQKNSILVNEHALNREPVPLIDGLNEWWLLRLSPKVLTLLRLSVHFFQLRLTKKLKINFFCFKELTISKPVFFVKKVRGFKTRLTSNLRHTSLYLLARVMF